MLFQTKIESKVFERPPVKNALLLGAPLAGMQNMKRAKNEPPRNSSAFDFQNNY